MSEPLVAFTDVSNWLLEDNTFNLEGELIADFAEAFGKAEGLAFLKGDGLKQPKGLLRAAGIVQVSTGVADGFGPRPFKALSAFYHELPSVHAQNAVWIMNNKTLGRFRGEMDDIGRPIMADPVTAGMPTLLFGRPVVEMPDMDDVAPGSTPIMLGDLQGYRIVDRIGFVTLRDPAALATKGQTRFHVRKRVGGDVTHPDRFLKLKVSA